MGSLLGFLAILLRPIPFVLNYYEHMGNLEEEEEEEAMEGTTKTEECWIHFELLYTLILFYIHP